MSSHFVPRGEFNEYRGRMDERCNSELKKIAAIEEKQASIDKKITATLVFVIVTLASILTAIGSGLFH